MVEEFRYLQRMAEARCCFAKPVKVFLFHPIFLQNNFVNVKATKLIGGF